nr:hypothetical protein [Pseudoclavibacter sp. Marseille-Q3772]
MPSLKRKTGLRPLDRVGVIAILSCAMLLGAVIGSLLFPVAPPPTLRSQTEVDSYPVEEVSFDDPLSLEATIGIGGNTTALSPDAGRITATRCRANAVIKSGEEVLRLNEQPYTALHTKTPLWRPLKLGDTGNDVRALRDALIDLGNEIEPGETVDSVLIDKVRELTHVGPGNDVPVQRLIWLPAPAAAVRECTAPLGQTVAPDEPLITFAGTFESITFEPVERPLEGDRTLEIGGTGVPVRAKELTEGQLSAETITRLNNENALLSQLSQLGEDDPAMTVQASLNTPVTAYSLPPAAVIPIDLQHGKVCTSHGIQEVEILGNELGSTIVRSSSPLDTSVKRPNDDGSCA